MVATATSWALLLPAYGVFQRLLVAGVPRPRLC